MFTSTGEGWKFILWRYLLPFLQILLVLLQFNEQMIKILYFLTFLFSLEPIFYFSFKGIHEISEQIVICITSISYHWPRLLICLLLIWIDDENILSLFQNKHSIYILYMYILYIYILYMRNTNSIYWWKVNSAIDVMFSIVILPIQYFQKCIVSLDYIMTFIPIEKVTSVAELTFHQYM